MILVRDGAAEFHPVIGIAAISSAAVQIAVRDKWIGWDADTLLQQMQTKPTLKMAHWLQRVVHDALDEIYVDDFFEDQLLSRGELRSPRDTTITTLEVEAQQQRELHQKYASAAEHKRNADPSKKTRADWVRAARTHLFRSKRAEMLALLLRARRALLASGGDLTRSALSKLLRTSDGRRAVRNIIRKAKSERVGTAMADITVCGAVAPYNVLLGGKLVSMLLSSPEVVTAYRKRYQNARSVIASSLAGRPIVRSSDLVLLCTTSLYGVGSVSIIGCTCLWCRQANAPAMRYDIASSVRP